jgi:hypothetical protein
MALELCAIPGVRGGHLPHAVPVENTKTVDDRVFFPLKKSDSLVQLLLGPYHTHGKHPLANSKVLAMLEERKTAMVDDHFESRDKEDVGFDAEGQPLSEADRKKQKRRMKSRRSVQSALDLPAILNVQMPVLDMALGAPSSIIPVLSEGFKPLFAELTPAVIDYLHRAIEHELETAARPASSKLDRRAEKGVEHGEWWSEHAGCYIVPWFDHRGGFHRKYFRTLEEAKDFHARSQSRELPPPGQEDPESPHAKKRKRVVSKAEDEGTVDSPSPKKRGR